MKIFRLFCVLMLIFIVSLAITSAETEQVNEIIVRDVGNAGHGADLKIEFMTDALGLKHQLLVVPADMTFDLDTALASESFLIVFPDTEFVSRTMKNTSKDVTGNLIAEDTPYQVYILIAETTLSEPSMPITLRNETTVTTLIPSLESATGGMDTDAEGNIYLSDFGEAQSSRGATVYRITPEGEASIFFSTDGLEGASGSEFDSQGNFYQSSIRSGRVLKVTPEGEISFFADGLIAPVGITIDADDTLYVTNCQDGSIQRITSDRESSIFAESSLLNCPNGITMDDDSNFYVSNYNNNDVLKITPDGEVTLFADIPGANNAHILYREGLLYVISRTGYRIFTVTLDGDIETLAGSGGRGNEDGPALEATFNLPNDLSFSPDGRILYVNETNYETAKRNYPAVIRAIIFPRDDE